uniref:Uncharacterized protein n=1 Tax=Hucho hucho TaxID=62062 RepID=A0A4W5KMT6_9TELE
MTLVCPYLVNTGMFEGCRIRKEIEPFLPPLKPEFCVTQSMRAILTDQAMICTPRIVYMVNFMKRSVLSLSPINKYMLCWHEWVVAISPLLSSPLFPQPSPFLPHPSLLPHSSPLLPHSSPSTFLSSPSTSCNILPSTLQLS